MELGGLGLLIISTLSFPSKFLPLRRLYTIEKQGRKFLVGRCPMSCFSEDVSRQQQPTI